MIQEQYLRLHHPSLKNLVNREVEYRAMTNKDNRQPYNFDHETKMETLHRAGYRCEKCGKQDSATDRLQVHHQVSVWFARENPCLAIEVIKSLANSVALCNDCHKKEHQQESRAYYASLAPVVLTKWLESHIDPHKDDWRDKLKTVVTERS